MKPPSRLARRTALALAIVCGLLSAACLAEDPAPPAAFQSFARVGGVVSYTITDSGSGWSSEVTTTSVSDIDSFNVFFDSVAIGDGVHFQGVELMKQHALWAPSGSNSWARGWRADGALDGIAVGVGDEVRGLNWLAPPDEGVRVDPGLQSARYALYTTAGVRYLQTEDYFSFLGLGSILGRTSVETSIEHDLVGPQLGVGGVFETGVWRFEGVLLGLIGHQRVEYHQLGMFGEEATPGALNHHATAGTTASTNRAADEELAWNGELRLTTSCYLTPSLRADVGWRGVATSGIRNAAATTAWNAPDFGLHLSEGETASYDYWVLSLTHAY